MKPRIHKLIVVDEGRTFIVRLSFIEQSVQNEPPVSVSVISVEPATILGTPTKPERFLHE